ncbi:hypothetical protein WKI65_36815 [Streptomyces sp. MS1.AVA.3]|uniref:hypothetical protein n=1 Tax=Streptomyces decoyicus TaxID=249567 RepID=UPI0030C15895
MHKHDPHRYLHVCRDCPLAYLGSPKYANEHLDTAVAELNARSRKTLGWKTPAERFTNLLKNNLNNPRAATLCCIRHRGVGRSVGGAQQGAVTLPQ